MYLNALSLVVQRPPYAQMQRPSNSWMRFTPIRLSTSCSLDQGIANPWAPRNALTERSFFATATFLLPPAADIVGSVYRPSGSRSGSRRY